ncbi:MAG: porin [Rhizobiaceae bacterium]
MNIKSLLLGSAAALVAVTGARAADAVVVAEPEPVEYVRVCDTYGAGFFYIPGTETCMRIGGLLRYDIDWNNAPDAIYVDPTPDSDPVSGTITINPPGPNNTTVISFNNDGSVFINGVFTPRITIDLDAFDPEDNSATITQRGLDEGWAKTALARINVDVRSETEFGTFRRFIRLEGTSNSGTNSGGLNIVYAYVELGGLLVGLYESLYDGGLTPEFEQINPQGGRTHQIRYTFSGGNGITAAVSLEEEDYNLDYTPNVVGNLRIAQGWGSASAWAAYDATAEEWAAKGILTFKASDAITLELAGTYESGSSAYSVLSGWQGNVAQALRYYVSGGSWVRAIGGYEASLAGAVSFKANDKLTLRAGGQYFWNAHLNGSDDYAIGGQVDYTIVQNLLLRGQVRYNGGDSQDFWDGKIRLESSF